jgi:mono/diheme cytochrome c family protein
MRSLAIVGAAALACCVGCERMPNDMSEQARHDPAGTSPFFTDRQSDRRPPAGAVVHASGDLALASSGRAVRAGDAAMPPLPSGATALARGHERYAIYCLPCHGPRGDGDGEVVRRGFPAPPPFASDALREAPDTRLQGAILHGAGAMYPFADRVSAADAAAIVAYVRALQAAPGARGAAPDGTGATARSQPASSEPSAMGGVAR